MQERYDEFNRRHVGDGEHVPSRPNAPLNQPTQQFEDARAPLGPSGERQCHERWSEDSEEQQWYAQACERRSGRRSTGRQSRDGAETRPRNGEGNEEKLEKRAPMGLLSGSHPAGDTVKRRKGF